MSHSELDAWSPSLADFDLCARMTGETRSEPSDRPPEPDELARLRHRITELERKFADMGRLFVDMIPLDHLAAFERIFRQDDRS